MMSRNHYPMKSDVREKKDAYLLEIDLPGCQKEDIKAYIEDGYLHISASLNENKQKGAGRFLREERFHGVYKRSFYLGDFIDSDHMKATYKHGVLKLTIPKLEQLKEEPEHTIKIEG